jgi:4-amino-4-deoxy-L-arabinose transferase-like glycosyltransferase
MARAIRTPVFLLIVAVAAFGIRVGFTLAYRGSLSTVPTRSNATADEVEYDALARSLASGKGFAWEDGKPTSFRAPGLPFFLAAVYAVSDFSYPAVYLALAALGALGTVAAYLLTREITDDARGRWAAVLTAVYPPDIFACSFFFSEALFAPCLGFGLWLLARQERGTPPGEAAAAGVILGFAALTRSFGILFLPIFAAYLLVARPRGWAAAAAYALGFVAVVAPWTVRNYHVHGQPVLIATNGGATFYGGNNDVVTGHPRNYGNWVSTTRLPGRDLIDAQPDEVSHDRMEWKLGVDWVKQNPEKFALLGVCKVLRCWLPFIQWPSLKTYPVANVLSTAPFLALILIGLARTLIRRADRRAFTVPHLAMLASLIMVVIFWGDPRFRDANVPVLMAYAAVAASWLAGRLTGASLPGSADGLPSRFTQMTDLENGVAN